MKVHHSASGEHHRAVKRNVLKEEEEQEDGGKEGGKEGKKDERSGVSCCCCCCRGGGGCGCQCGHHPTNTQRLLGKHMALHCYALTCKGGRSKATAQEDELHVVVGILEPGDVNRQRQRLIVPAIQIDARDIDTELADNSGLELPPTRAVNPTACVGWVKRTAGVRLVIPDDLALLLHLHMGGQDQATIRKYFRLALRISFVDGPKMIESLLEIFRQFLQLIFC